VVDAAAIEELRTAQAQLSALVQGQLEALFAQIDFSDPVAARDLLLQLIPDLVDRYGASAETIARDWYAEHRAEAGLTSRYRVVAPPSSVTADRVQSKVRYLAGDLWTGNPSSMLGGLILAVDKYVKQPGRDVVAFNAARERARWARVPTGAKTCSWCLILASRDAVYTSKKAAEQNNKTGLRYHGACDCQAVLIGKDGYPPGYLPDEFYEMYTTARDEAGSGQLGDIAASMRRLYPEHVTDGVHTHDA
jgi:hypothetical protein